MAGCDYDYHDDHNDHDDDHCCEYYYYYCYHHHHYCYYITNTCPSPLLLHTHTHTRKPCPSICLPAYPSPGPSLATLPALCWFKPSRTPAAPTPTPRLRVETRPKLYALFFHSSLLRLPCLVYHASMCQSAPVHSAPARSPEPCSRANSSPSPIQILPTLGLTLSPGCALHAQAKLRQSATRCRQP
jgi:hypothetical protein